MFLHGLSHLILTKIIPILWLSKLKLIEAKWYPILQHTGAHMPVRTYTHTHAHMGFKNSKPEDATPESAFLTTKNKMQIHSLLG